VGVGGVVRRRLDLLALLAAEGAGALDGHDVVGVGEVVAPAAPDRVLAGAADHPVVALAAEDGVGAVGPTILVHQAGAVGRVGDAAVERRTLAGVEVQEPHQAAERAVVDAQVGLVGRPVRVEQDRAPRVVLVVEGELAEPGHDRAVVVPGVVVHPEVQQVTGVERTRPVAAVRVRLQGAVGGRPHLGVGVPDRLAAGDRVVARAAVQEVARHAAQQAGRVRVVLVEAADDRRVVLHDSAEAAEDDVVGVVGVEQRLVAAGGARGQVVRGEVDGLLQVALDVDDRGLDVARGGDPLVEVVAAQDGVVLGAATGRQERRHTVQRLAHGRVVAAGEDPAVVAEDSVLAHTAGDPVVAPAADDVVVVGVAVGHVRAAAEVDPVVAEFAVDLVVAEDLGPTGGVDTVASGRVGDDEDEAAVADGLAAAGMAGALGAQVEPVGTEVRAAGGVVEQVDAAHDELFAVRVVVDEGHVLGRGAVAAVGGVRGVVADVGAVDAGDPDDPAVVAHHRVGVASVPVRRQRIAHSHVAVVVASAVEARAAEQQVGAVGTVVHADQAEEVGGTAEDVVLAEVAEGDVVAAAAFEVVLAVGGRPVEGRHQIEVADQVAGAGVGRVVAAGAGRHAAVRAAGRADVADRGMGEFDAAVALQDVVAELAEDQVVGGAAGQVVVAPAAGPDHAVLEGERVPGGVVDQVLRPPRGGVRVAVVAGGAVGEQGAGGVGGRDRAARRQIGAAVDDRAAQGLEASGGDDAVLDIGAGGALGDPRGAVEDDVVAEDEVVGLVAVGHVVAGAADEDVASEVAVDHVVVAVLQGDRDDLADRGDPGGLDLLQQRVRRVRVGHVLVDPDVVAADDVVVDRLRAAQDGAGG